MWLIILCISVVKFTSANSTYFQEKIIMNTQLRTAVDILQELIVIHNTRVECSNKILSKQLSAPLKKKFNRIINQSNLFIESLMAETPNFGDAVKADADRSNTYNKIYNNLLREFETSEIELLD